MITILFNTARFNLSKVKPHFINDCCFGEDFASWLSEKIKYKKISCTEPFQEDWGWCFYIEYHGQSYFIGINGVADNVANDIVNEVNIGQWRVIIDKQNSFLAKFLGKNKITRNEEIISVIYEILNQEKSFTELDFEN